MKRNTKYSTTATIWILMICFTAFLSSCLKSRDGRTDFSSLQPIVLIPEGGIAAFGSQALLFPGTDTSDTAFFSRELCRNQCGPGRRSNYAFS